MSFPKYPKYKPSGVDWLEEVPEHWNVLALKRIANLKSGDSITGESIEEVGEFPVLGGNGLRGYSDSFTHDGHFVVIGRQGALCGNINYAKGKFWASEHAVVAAPLTGLNTVWRGEMLRAMNLNQHSVSAAQPGLSMEFVGNLRTVFPPMSEQTAIAAILDRETGKIDELVAEQRRLIELLKEKRQAVISHAVTKGLNPHAPTKPSGIEWLGDVPEHWEVNRLDWICTDINDINHEMPNAVDDGILVLSAKDLLDDGTLNFETDVKMISEEDFERLSKKIRPRRGDIIYSRIGAALGKARLVETDVRFNISYSCCVVRVPSNFPISRLYRTFQNPKANRHVGLEETTRGRNSGCNSRGKWE